MNAKELIEILSRFPPDEKVQVNFPASTVGVIDTISEVQRDGKSPVLIVSSR